MAVSPEPRRPSGPATNPLGKGKGRCLLVVGIDEMGKGTPRVGGCMLIDCPNVIIRVHTPMPCRTGLLNPEPDQRHKRRLCIILPHMASHGTFMGEGRAAEMGTAAVHVVTT